MASEARFSWRRSLAWAVSLAVHAAVVIAMLLPRESAMVDPAVDVAPAWDTVPVGGVTVIRIDEPRDPIPPRKPEATSRDADDVPTTGRSVVPKAVPSRIRFVAEPVPPIPSPTRASTPSSDTMVPVPRAISYLDDRARALLPQENLYAAKPPPREGDFYTPGDGGEDDVFYRPRALDPNPSRFAHAWRPRGNLVDDWLGQLVEKTTGQVSVPLNAKFSLVCGTVAGLAGSCVIVRNGGTGVIVQRPPPAPWDRSNRVQCRELRQALEEAEEAVQVAYFLDRLSALCGPGSGGAIDTPDGAAQNDEARREAGLPEAPPALDQRAL